MKSVGISPLLAGLAIGALLAASPASAANVGVTAAVNTDARGRPPGAAPRVLSLGNAVVFDEEVTTDASGLVQILLLDGTTFTVGPNSHLTIDEFVYDPDTGDAKVVASLTRGAFRFVGARTSQTEGGATIRTPVGTIGIRGAVSNIAYDPASGEAFAALVAGKSLTITDGDGTTRIVYENGYTAVIAPDGKGGTTTTVRKSTAAEAQAFLQQLAGKPGTSGGSGNPPSDADVAGSGVAGYNSGLPDAMNVPGSPNPVQSTPPDKAEEDVAGLDDFAGSDFFQVSNPEDLYNPDSLPFGGSATYEGTAQGTVTRQTEGGPVQTSASGDFFMSYDFSYRDGYMYIDGFDDVYASGGISDYDGNGSFDGELSGSDYSQCGECYNPLSGSASGAFVDDGPNVAAGVIGTFSLEGDGVSAVGSFGGVGSAGGYENQVLVPGL